MGLIILGLPEAGITSITNAVFEDIVGTVSEISGWSSGQLTKWAEKAVSVSFHFLIIFITGAFKQETIMHRIKCCNRISDTTLLQEKPKLN